MIETLRRPTIVLLVVLAVAAGGVLAYDSVVDWWTPDPPLEAGTGSSSGIGSSGGGGHNASEPAHANWTTVTVIDEDGTELSVVSVRVADSFGERYTGLSDTESLGPNEGMLFVHDAEGDYAYVMRDMAFPIDIVFVDADRTITTIHHAPTEEPPLTRYRGRGKWVLEVPYEWTTRNGVEVGDRIRIEWANETATPGNGTAES